LTRTGKGGIKLERLLRRSRFRRLFRWLRRQKDVTSIVTTLGDDSTQQPQGTAPHRPDQRASAFLEAQREALEGLNDHWELDVPPGEFANISTVKQGPDREGDADLVVLYGEGPLSSFCMHTELLGRPTEIYNAVIAQQRRRHPMVFRGFIGEPDGRPPSYLSSLRLYPVAGLSQRGTRRRIWLPNTVRRKQIVMWPPFHAFCAADEVVTPSSLREIAVEQYWMLAGVEMMALMLWDPDGAGRLPDLPATIYLGAFEANGPDNQPVMPYLRLELPDGDGPLELRIGLQNVNEPVFDHCMMPRIEPVRV
jgi:hypothetical protein